MPYIMAMARKIKAKKMLARSAKHFFDMRSGILFIFIYKNAAMGKKFYLIDAIATC